MVVVMQYLQRTAYDCFTYETLMWQEYGDMATPCILLWQDSSPTLLPRNLAPLCLLPRSRMLQALLAFAMLSTLRAILSFTLSVTSRVRISQVESPEDDCFSQHNPALSIDPTNVTTNPGYSGTCNHALREAASVILTKPVGIVGEQWFLLA